MRNLYLIVFSLLLLGAAGCGGRGARTETLDLAMEDDVVTLDPHGHDDGITHSVLFNIYEPLVAFDPQMRIAPALAVSWENPNDVTWRFHLRPKVRFHSGQRFTAEDVAFSLRRARSYQVGHYLSQVKDVRIQDSLTVEVVTYQPTAVLLNKLTFVAMVPRASLPTIVQPMGTGPYRCREYQKGDHLLLEANLEHWRRKPRIASARFWVIPDDRERLQALLQGRIQLARDLEGSARKAIEGRPDLVFISQPGLGVSHLGVNLRMKGPLADRRVRQAIFWALDPEEIVRETEMEAVPCHQLLSPYIVGYLPQEDIVRPDRERARRLLKQAGWGQGLRLTLEQSTSGVVTSGPIIKRQLKDVGIELNTVGFEWTGFSRRLKNKQSPFYQIGWSCSSGDASDLFDACLHTDDGENYGQANHSGYSRREVDDLIERSHQILDQKQRIDLLHRIQRKVLEDMPLIPLYIRSRTFGASRGIVFRPRQDARIILDEIEWARNNIR